MLCVLFSPLLAYDRVSFRHWQQEICPVSGIPHTPVERGSAAPRTMPAMTGTLSEHRMNPCLLWSRMMMLWAQGTI